MEGKAKFENFIVGLLKSSFKFNIEPGTYFSSFSTGISAGPSTETKILGKLKKEDFENVIK